MKTGNRFSIGIDLGTSYSLVSVFNGDEPVVIPNTLGSFMTPSVVGIDDDGSILVGAVAQDRLITHPERTTSQFKRLMGTKKDTVLAGKSFRPEELSALVLRALKEDAEAYLH